MTRLPESSLWEEEIELISRSERVSGGLDGVANRPLKSLANRTRYLKDRASTTDELIAEKVSAIKTFADGATLESPREEILYGAYRLVWTGEFPKIVPAASKPETTGGVGAGSWAYTSDAAIRSNLASLEGFSLIGQVSSFAELSSITPRSVGQSVLLRAHPAGWAAMSHGPVGGGEFIARKGTAVDDGGYICVPTGQTAYYWQRIPKNPGKVCATEFGLYDGAILDRILDNAVNFCIKISLGYLSVPSIGPAGYT